MRIVIAGADGQLGRCLQDSLVHTSHEVFAMGRNELDITDIQRVFECFSEVKPHVIINAAAYTAVDKAEEESDLAWTVNSIAVENLAAAADRHKALLVHISTDYVFDGTNDLPYVERDPVRPMGIYGKSKLGGEKAAEQADRFLIVRTAWVFSEYGHNFLKTMIKLAYHRESLAIVNDQTGTPTYAGDLAVAVIRLCEAPPENGVYHFSGGEPCTWFEFAQFIFQACSEIRPSFPMPQLAPISSDEFPTPAKRPAYSVLNAEKIFQSASISSGDWRKAARKVCSRLLQG